MSDDRTVAPVLTRPPELAEPLGATSLSWARALSPLAWVLVLGGLLRLALWAEFAGQPLHVWDERDYNTIAVHLVRDHQFSLVSGRPTSLRPPLYPLLIAGVYEVFGLENYQAVRLLQAGLSLLVAVLLYRFGSMAYSRKVGLCLAGLFAFYPSLLVYDNLVLTELPFTAFLCGACFSIAQAHHRRSLTLLACAGLLLGLAALTRSVLWLFPGVLGAILLRTWPGDLRQRLLAAGSLVLAYGLVMTPWTIRNTRLERTFQVVDCMSGRNFMMGNYEFTPMHRAWDAITIGGARSWDHVLADADPAYLKASQGQRDKLAMRYGVHFIRSHPVLTLHRDVVKFFDFWGLERELVAGVARGWYGKPSPLVLVLLTSIIFGSYAFVLVAGIFGAFMVPPADRRIHELVLLLIAFICGLHTLSFGHSRYHLPLIPLILLYASAAIVHRKVVWSRRRSWPFLAACGLSGIVVLSWLWEIAVVDFDRYWQALRLAV